MLFRAQAKVKDELKKEGTGKLEQMWAKQQAKLVWLCGIVFGRAKPFLSKTVSHFSSRRY